MPCSEPGIPVQLTKPLKPRPNWWWDLLHVPHWELKQQMISSNSATAIACPFCRYLPSWAQSSQIQWPYPSPTGGPRRKEPWYARGTDSFMQPLRILLPMPALLAHTSHPLTKTALSNSVTARLWKPCRCTNPT